MASRKIHVEITGDAGQLEKAFGKAGDSGRSFAKTVGKAGVAGAVLGLGAAVKIGFGEFMEAQKVAAQTNAVLKSTGGVANVTAKDVGRLSEALMRKSGVDDEAIASGQNMLLTFTKIRNETGKGNDVFNQATKATLDLSVAMGKDMQSSATLVGKALNDPIKGISALSRVGVQLTEDQKDTIKQMVKLGDTAGAQKVILGELETQFGGSAEAAGKTFGGQINIAKERLTNLAGEGVGKALPKLAELGNWFTMEAVPKIRQLVAYLNETFMPVIRGLVNVFRDAFAAIGRLLEEHKTEVATIVTGVKAVLKGIATVFEEVIFPALRFYFKEGGPFDTIFGTAIKIVSGVVTAIGKIVGAVRDAVNGVKAFWNGDGGKAFRTVFGAMEDALRPVVSAFQAVVDSVKWLIDNVSKIPDVRLPFSGPRENDPFKQGTEVGKASPVAGVTDKLWDEIALGRGMGLTLSSGFRPGDPGDHGRGHAIDMSGPASTMATFAMAAMGRPGTKDVIYGGLSFWQDNGRRVSTWAGNEALRSDHFDHAHVSVFDKGGWLPPKSATLAINNTPHWEPVGPPNRDGVIENHVHVMLDSREIFESVQTQAIRYGRSNGRPAFS